MNADGSPGVDATIEVHAGFLLPLAVTMLILGIVITRAAIVLIVVGTSGRRSDMANQTWPTETPFAVASDGGRFSTPPFRLDQGSDQSATDLFVC